MFGCYDDIPAKAFYNAQIDTEYRKVWDELVIKLDIVDRNEETGDEVVQWVMEFPVCSFIKSTIFDSKPSVFLFVSVPHVPQRVYLH